MNPRQFLQLGGIVLILVGILGFVGVIGPDADDSIFSDDWWFDNGENVAHTVLGVAGVTAAYVFPANLHRPLVLLIGALGIFFGVYNLFSEEFLGSDLQNPFDTILHFVVGGWALFAAWYGRSMASPGAGAAP
ncbi:MAG: hypothetical protein WD689_08930 [Gaiellaceae bacterium]